MQVLRGRLRQQLEQRGIQFGELFQLNRDHLDTIYTQTSETRDHTRRKARFDNSKLVLIRAIEFLSEPGRIVTREGKQLGLHRADAWPEPAGFPDVLEFSRADGAE
jgi:hypothetical protein